MAYGKSGDNNIDKIAAYFREGEKAVCCKVGVEIEHFVIDEAGNSASYEEVESVLKKLKTDKDTLFMEKEHLLGFSNDEYSVTLEPAAQLEISIAPKQKVEEMEKIYMDFRKRVDFLLKQGGFHLVNTGYHPYKKADQLALIPKKRYEYMNHYFETKGTLGKCMMRATASVQVCVDYESETDFVEKYRLACILSPILALLTENSPVFEGRETSRHMIRTFIWENTDNERCGIFPGTFAADFGYQSYAKYLYQNPPILITDDRGRTRFTGRQTLAEIYDGREMNRQEIEHVLSMFFPDVRLKQYIEIRVADSMEIERVTAYVSFIQTLFYRKSAVQELLAYFGTLVEGDVEQAKNSLMKKGYEGEAYGKSVKEILGKLQEVINKVTEKSLGELNREYRELLAEDTESHLVSAKKAYEYMQNSTAKYHGRCVRTLYMPKIFRNKDIRIFEQEIDTLYRIFEKVVQAYYEDEAYRKLFGFEEKLEALILRKRPFVQGENSVIPMARIDIFYDEETGEFRFCEFNTDGASAMNEDRELNHALRLTKAYRQFADSYEVRSLELFTSWVQQFLKIWEAEGKGRKPQVAIVDFMEHATEQEFFIFQQAFAEQGILAQVCEIRELRYLEGVLFTESGMPIDAIYRRAVTSDIMKHYGEVGDFLQAVREGAVCLIGDFHTQIVHNKILFSILHHEKTKRFLTEEEREYVRKHVPYTVPLEKNGFDYEEVIRNKDNWIIKPRDSYGSKGVFAGGECEPEEWKRKVDESIGKQYLLQEFCKPYETENIDLLGQNGEFRKYSNLTGLFVYNGKLQGIYSRISGSEIISTQYSEMALPTIVVAEKKWYTITDEKLSEKDSEHEGDTEREKANE